MNNLKKKLHKGTPEEVIEKSNEFASKPGIQIVASQSTILGSNTAFIIDFYKELSQQLVIDNKDKV